MSDPKIKFPIIETVPLKSLTWGEGYPTVENHIHDYYCNNDQCDNKSIDYWNLLQQTVKNGHIPNFLIGVRHAPGESKLDRAAMIECPHCFQRAWFHIPYPLAEKIFDIKQNNLNKSINE